MRSRAMEKIWLNDNLNRLRDPCDWHSVEFNGDLKVHSSLLNVVLHD